MRLRGECLTIVAVFKHQFGVGMAEDSQVLFGRHLAGLFAQHLLNAALEKAEQHLLGGVIGSLRVNIDINLGFVVVQQNVEDVVGASVCARNGAMAAGVDADFGGTLIE